MAGVRTKVQNYQLIQDGRSMLQFEAEATVHDHLMKNDPQYAAQAAGQSGFTAPGAGSIDTKLDALTAAVETLVANLSK